jgi:hypothetical protein
MDSSTIRRIAVAAHDTHPNTVKRYLDGQSVLPAVARRIEYGLRSEGLERLIRAGVHGKSVASVPKSRA